MAFLRRAERMLADKAPAQLDYDMLTAALGAVQASSESARAARAEPGACEGRPLVELLSGGESWREAVARQGGCFHDLPATAPIRSEPYAANRKPA